MPMKIGLLMGTNENWVLDANGYWALMDMEFQWI
jgi:hypothetical protein